MIDLRIDDALIVDGTGEPAFLGTIGICGERIRFVERGPVPEMEAAQVVDVARNAVSPGFIDMHSHSDLALLGDQWPEAKLMQGVTTEVIGQDGLGYAPVDASVLAELRERLAGWNGSSDELSWDWTSVAGFLRLLDRTRTNAAYLVPHGTLRMMAGADGPAIVRPAQLRAMADLLDAGLADGAVGLSTGLGYVPAAFASTAELVALCEIVAARGGYFCPHHRSYGRGALAAYQECIDIARRTGVRLHFAHAHLSFEENRDASDAFADMVDRAIAEGVAVTFDSYPYDAAMTTLVAQLPGWAQTGTVQEQLARLGEAPTIEALRVALDEVGSDGHGGLTVDWSRVVLAGSPPVDGRDYVGLSLADIARDMGLEPYAACLRVLIASRLEATCILRVGHEHNVRALMRLPMHTVGSDGLLNGARPHPRAWGSFARFLGRYVRDERLLTLEEGVRHLTSAPADVLRADPDIGRVRPGLQADLAVFDPARIRDVATYDDPRAAAEGVHHVLVRGRFAVRDGRLTGRRDGRALRAGRAR